MTLQFVCCTTTSSVGCNILSGYQSASHTTSWTVWTISCWTLDNWKSETLVKLENVIVGLERFGIHCEEGSPCLLRRVRWWRPDTAAGWGLLTAAGWRLFTTAGPSSDTGQSSSVVQLHWEEPPAQHSFQVSPAFRNIFRQTAKWRKFSDLQTTLQYVIRDLVYSKTEESPLVHCQTC